MADNEHEGMKKCTKCGEWKPATAEFFNRDKTKKDGLRSVCRGCRRGQAGEYYQKNKDRKREYGASNVGRLCDAVKRIRRKTGATIYLRDMTEEQKETLANQYVAVRTLEKTEKELLAASGKKRCSRCDRVLDYCCFNKNIAKNGGVCAWCRECSVEYGQEYNQQNKDKKKEYSREYYEKNKDRAREYYQQNKDKIKEYHREYYQQKKDKIREYYQQNKEKIKERASARYQQNKDKMKEYYQQNKDYYLEYQRKYRQRKKYLTK